MRVSTYAVRELLKPVTRLIKEVLDKDLLGVIVFGSTIYLGRGDDIDLIVITEEDRDLRKRLSTEYLIKSTLEKRFKGLTFDVHVMSVREFKENLRPGTFLSGLALGYEIIEGSDEIEHLILNFLKELSRGRHVLRNKYGEWNLSHHAGITYRLKLTRKSKRLT